MAKTEGVGEENERATKRKSSGRSTGAHEEYKVIILNCMLALNYVTIVLLFCGCKFVDNLILQSSSYHDYNLSTVTSKS